MFENLTMAPIDKDLIDIKILNKDEKNWLNDYHKKVFDNLKKFMNKIEIIDLKKLAQLFNISFHSFSKINFIFNSFA